MRLAGLKVVVVLVSFVLLGAACSKGGGSSGGSEGGTIKIGSDTANDHGTKDVSGKSSLEVEQDDFYFDPTIIKGKPGQKVELELKNEGKNLHNLTIESLHIDQDVNTDGSATVKVTIPQSGTLEFYCKYHRAKGMVGELEAA